MIQYLISSKFCVTLVTKRYDLSKPITITTIFYIRKIIMYKSKKNLVFAMKQYKLIIKICPLCIINALSNQFSSFFILFYNYYYFFYHQYPFKLLLTYIWLLSFVSQMRKEFKIQIKVLKNLGIWMYLDLYGIPVLNRGGGDKEI